MLLIFATRHTFIKLTKLQRKKDFRNSHNAVFHLSEDGKKQQQKKNSAQCSAETMS